MRSNIPSSLYDVHTNMTYIQWLLATKQTKKSLYTARNARKEKLFFSQTIFLFRLNELFLFFFQYIVQVPIPLFGRNKYLYNTRQKIQQIKAQLTTHAYNIRAPHRLFHHLYCFSFTLVFRIFFLKYYYLVNERI